MNLTPASSSRSRRMTRLPGLRHRRRLLRHRRRQGAARARLRRSTASRRPTASAATGSSATRTGCRRRTARCTSTPRASGWSTRTSRCRSRYPDFPHHTQIAALLRRLRRPLRLPRPHPLRDAASSAPSAAADGAGRVASRRRRRRERYDALLVANGHHWDPRWPEPAFPGGTLRRACRCTPTTTSATTRVLRGKRVVVLGMGNSAMDIAVEASFTRRARRILAARRGAHVIPKYLFGRPLDQLGAVAADPVSRSAAGASRAMLTARRRATWSATACPSPTTASARRTRRSPTTSSTALAHGEITPKPNIARARGRPRALRRRHESSRPTSSSTARATRSRSRSSTRPDRRAGQRPAALPPRLPPDDRRRVLRRAAAAARRDHAARRGAVGSGSPTTSPARTRCPDRAGAAGRHGARARARCSSATSRSKRHTMQVDFDDYLVDARQGAQRRRRARAARGNALPVPARAAAAVAA